ncbi:phage tail protein [Duganella guangzhouensis]|nr:tail fiber protein [Duganella guangzhouensis]
MKNPAFSRRYTLACALAAMGTLPLGASACSSEPTVGDVCIVAMNWCPRMYVPADGSLLPISQYQGLFSLIVTSYGGDGRTTFAVPDLRGRAPVGTGTGANPALPTVTFAQKLGQPAAALSPAQLPLHSHGATFVPTLADTPLIIPAQPGNLSVKANLPVAASATGALGGTTVALGGGQNGYLSAIKGASGVDDVTFTGPYTTQDPGTGSALLPARVEVSGSPALAATTVQVKAVNGGAVTVLPGGGVTTPAPLPTQAPSLGMTYCIAAQGLYPERP